MNANCLIRLQDPLEPLGSKLAVTTHMLIRVVPQSEDPVRFPHVVQGRRICQPQCVQMLAVLSHVRWARYAGRRLSFLSGLDAGLSSTGACARPLFLCTLTNTGALLRSLLTSATMMHPFAVQISETTSAATVAGPMLFGWLRMSAKPAIGVGAGHIGGLRSTAG